MNNYKAQAQGRSAVFTLVLVMAIMVMIFIPACYYEHVAVMPTLHHLIQQLVSSSNSNTGTAP